VGKVVFAVPDPKYGACGSVLNLCTLPGALWQVETASGVLQAECLEVLREFFREARKRPPRKPKA